MNAIELLNQAQSLFDAKEYDKALTVLALAEREGKLCTESLLLKAACIQLSTNASETPEDVFSIYSTLLRLRPSDPRVRNEIGYFLLNVRDEAAPAAEHFALALQTFSKAIAETITGLMKARMELGASDSDARAMLNLALADVKKMVNTHV
jgi:hypothetical protein